MQNTTLPTILVINTSDDYLDIMRHFLNAEGYVVATLNISSVKSGDTDINAVFKEHDPKVVLYDVAFPYKENWLQYQNILNLDISKGREFILTTPNLDALQDQIGKEVDADPIVDKEIDLRKIVKHINKAWEAKMGSIPSDTNRGITGN